MSALSKLLRNRVVDLSVADEAFIPPQKQVEGAKARGEKIELPWPEADKDSGGTVSANPPLLRGHPFGRR